MRLVKAERPRKPYIPRTENRKILEEFIASDCDCCEVLDYTAATAYGAASSLNRSISWYRLGGIKAIVREERLYLIKLI